MSDHIELRPCPFCGGESAFNSFRTSDRELTRLNKRDTGYGVNCIQCGVNNRGFVLGHETREAAAKAWNRRALTVGSSGPEYVEAAREYELAQQLAAIPKPAAPEPMEEPEDE